LWKAGHLSYHQQEWQEKDSIQVPATLQYVEQLRLSRGKFLEILRP
jgi:hypothetical protein